MTAHDSALSALRGHVGELAAALMLWGTRDDTKPQPDVRRAANHAMDAIDAALRELHGVRAQLIGEIRVADDAAAGGGPVKIRLHGTEDECREAVELLGSIMLIRSVSDPYPDRGPAR